MRHLKHRHQLGVKKEHREAIMASLSAALFRHDRIETTLGYAKALRPFAEKIITLAKKAAATDDTAKKLHFRRLALAKVRDESAVHFLFADKVKKFEKREGGYLRTRRPPLRKRRQRRLQLKKQPQRKRLPKKKPTRLLKLKPPLPLPKLKARNLLRRNQRNSSSLVFWFANAPAQKRARLCFFSTNKFYLGSSFSTCFFES